MPHHTRLDLTHWSNEFSLERLRAEAVAFVHERRRALPAEYPDEAAVARHVQIMFPGGQIVVGPHAVAVNEQLRTESGAASRYAGRRISTDVVVWAKGEPENRAITKTGGVPYRSGSAPWPEDANGPMRFIAQVCFADSTDIVPDLPGEVLLIFGDEDALLGEPERLRFEWVRIGVDDLIDAIPAYDYPLTPFYGVLHRTEDWSDAGEDAFQGVRDPDALVLWEGTKIGGVPRFIQGEDEAPDGRFIGALGSISVATTQRQPFVNVVEPRGWSRENDLMIGDMGSLYLFLGDDGRVAALAQGY